MTSSSAQVIVAKMNPSREEVWQYEGRLLRRDPHSVLIEAFFNMDEASFQGVTLRRNDRSIERFYDDRWYNIFEIHDREDDRLKAWYCNITRPAEFTPGKVAYVDLALDLLVYPNGSYLVLDQEEFEELALDSLTRNRALRGMKNLMTIVQNGTFLNELK